jgi:uncharacterized protein
MVETAPDAAHGTPEVAAGGAEAAYAPTGATLASRGRERMRYDRGTVHAVLDEALVCHLGFVAEGAPVVLPTVHARVGERLYVHGSTGSRPLRHAATHGLPVCVTVTLVDGIVLARSAFHHSMNYRSVVLYGTARPVIGDERLEQALEAFTEKLVPGRWADVRWPTKQELKGTAVLSLPITEGSAKVRTGPPVDDDEDYELDVWAGVVPMALAASPAEPDPLLRAGIPRPAYVR